jgi:hypothetical protein
MEHYNARVAIRLTETKPCPQQHQLQVAIALINSEIPGEISLSELLFPKS